MIREQVYSAVFALFAGLTSGNGPLFKTATRRTTTFDQVLPNDTPCILFKQGPETAEYKLGRPTKWISRPTLVLYVTTDQSVDGTVVATQLLNPLVDAIVDAIQPDNPVTNACTLGGLVSHCAVAGNIEIIDGTLGDTAIAIIPLELVISP